MGKELNEHANLAECTICGAIQLKDNISCKYPIRGNRCCCGRLVDVKPIKTNWSKSEVANLLINAMGDAVKNDRQSNHVSISEFSIDWIERNL